eukprot:TRINITY_DN10030_c0_g1_i3.p1 TRINITY_DN10030_c0_g1~~TRINITY_DN10030_c0_g1_i3.p1  ORF type:complete len:147 (+),score=11.75 TRINITY_DN10030_c0_g1_i3:147-587(+)
MLIDGTNTACNNKKSGFLDALSTSHLKQPSLSTRTTLMCIAMRCVENSELDTASAKVDKNELKEAEPPHRCLQPPKKAKQHRKPEKSRRPQKESSCQCRCRAGDSLHIGDHVQANAGYIDYFGTEPGLVPKRVARTRGQLSSGSMM